MFRRIAELTENVPHIERVEAYVRSRFVIPDASIVLVSESTGKLPGYPSREVTVRFWIGEDRYRFRLFKRAAEINEDDLPPRWMLASLADDGDADCC